jgi:hypothetical protein
MFIFSIRTVVLAVAVSASSLSSAATLSVQSELLCSPERWSRFAGQFGGLAKVDSGFDYAANFSSFACLA